MVYNFLFQVHMYECRPIVFTPKYAIFSLTEYFINNHVSGPLAGPR
jgi:hypothetical protein